MAENRSNDRAERRAGLVYKARRLVKKDLRGVAAFSLVINILMLTGPIYMLQVYDRILTSRSMVTLIAITILMIGLFVAMGIMEMYRSKVLARTGLKFEQTMGPSTLRLWLLRGHNFPKGMPSPMRDVATIRRFLSGSAPGSFFDIPWTPIYLAIIFMLHPLLGALGAVGAVILIVVSIFNDRAVRKNAKNVAGLTAEQEVLTHQGHEGYETVLSMGMRPQIVDKWTELSGREQREILKVSDATGAALAFSKSFRMIIQSAILGLGAALALQQIVSPGAMIAASILLGRALAPVQTVLGQWQQFKGTTQAYRRLSKFHEMTAETATGTNLPRPQGHLTVEQVVAAPPGVKKTVLNGINFNLAPGHSMAVIGPSASGKSSLAKLLVGLWMPVAGKVRLDGATLDQWDKDLLGQYVGYLPQEVTLFSGTIGQNIARFSPAATEEGIIAAAQEAGIHELILRLPGGYDMPITGGSLSGGQKQLIGLARALYGRPSLVVLDEPNSNLDNNGEKVLKDAIVRIKARGGSVVVIAHRAGVLNAVDYLLVLEEGKQVAFGLRQGVYKFLNARKNAAAQRSGSLPMAAGQAPQAAEPRRVPLRPMTQAQASQLQQAQSVRQVPSQPNTPNVGGAA